MIQSNNSTCAKCVLSVSETHTPPDALGLCGGAASWLMTRTFFVDVPHVQACIGYLVFLIFAFLFIYSAPYKTAACILYLENNKCSFAKLLLWKSMRRTVAQPVGGADACHAHWFRWWRG
ncbi:hypothetical protein EYF80_015244 [Liparis tanakae]|uniref:Uncharacterized protein n=1 Tax=Liparis tanakae TaxID=230148 RepID=A0A4Z2IAX8_9TELE|nr:hypothetical protein EYF80_015244 [Liparis tanakae]